MMDAQTYMQTMDELRRLEALNGELVAALRAAHSDIQRCPGHTIDMLGRIEAAVAKVEAG